MRLGLSFGVLLFLVYGAVAPPVTEKKKTHETDETDTNEVHQQAVDVEYKKYLEEVVQVLENDDEFKQRLLKADPEDIKTGRIAKDVEYLSHHVRTRLDELKRKELDRLRHLARQQYEHDNGIDRKHLKVPAHIDGSNPHTFEAEDLRKLITQTTKELEDADRERRKDFKEYEMQKELEYQEQLKMLDEQNRLEASKQHEQLLQKHNQHAPIHHPGSKQQFEQVWEEQDHLNAEDFNPKTFFHLHDLDGNGVWDAVEVKALFKKELDKMYDPNAPEDDIRERFEEMERMREHVFNETDTNRDQLISFPEFMEQTKRREFQDDRGWDPIDQKDHPVYNEDEYRLYAQQHETEIRRMIEQGIIPAAPPGYLPMIIPSNQQHQEYPPGVQPPSGFHIPPPGPGGHPNTFPQGQQRYPNVPQQPPYQPNPGIPQQNPHHSAQFQQQPPQQNQVPQTVVNHQQQQPNAPVNMDQQQKHDPPPHANIQAPNAAASEHHNQKHSAGGGAQKSH